MFQRLLSQFQNQCVFSNLVFLIMSSLALMVAVLLLTAVTLFKSVQSFVSVPILGQIAVIKFLWTKTRVAVVELLVNAMTLSVKTVVQQKLSIKTFFKFVENRMDAPM